MKIKEIAIYLTECDVKNVFAYSRSWMPKRGGTLVEITTDDGIVGWGEAFGPARMSAGALELIKPLLIGMDALNTEKIWNDIYARFREHGQKGPLVDALSAIDIALWDIRGKYFKLPIHRLLGGPIRTQVPVYASGLFHRKDGSPEEYLADEARGYISAGYNALKLKVGFGIDSDVRAVRAVRQAIGPAPSLMIDANEAYDARTAITLGRRLETFDIAWFEEPVPPEDLEGYIAVKNSQPIPVAGGEAEFTRYGFREILVRRAMDILQPDICAAGGFSECKKIVDMAHAFGIRVNPHTWGTPIAIAASLQLLAVLPDNPPALYPIPPMLEYDLTEHGIREAMMTDSLRPVGGMISIPEGPGLGIDVDREIIKRFAIT
jgi:D-galactarolactone cycloisomerase